MFLPLAPVLAVAAFLLGQAPQPAPQFEVASIKPVETTGHYRATYPPEGGLKAVANVEWLIGIAYEIRPFDRIVGEPTWARTQFFEIDVRVGAPVSRAENLSMLRALLEERFGLAWHMDSTGRAEVYALTVAREDGRLGPGLRRSETACLKDRVPVSERRLRPGVAVSCGSASEDGASAGGSVPLSLLESTIQLALGQEVIDRTGLTGRFDYHVTLPRHAGGISSQNAGDVSLFTAVEEQLGLKLKREEIVRDVFVVERVSPPTPN